MPQAAQRRPFRPPLFTPHSRSLVYRKCVATGDKWKGTRRGVRMEIGLAEQPDLNGCRIAWRARIDGYWKSGTAESIRAAIDTIEDARAQ